MPGTGWQARRAPDGAAIRYKRHRTEQTILYRFVQQHAANLIAQTEASTRAELPRFIKDDFDTFLAWGILAYGFLRLADGNAPCGSRHAACSAAARVLSLPIPLRALLSHRLPGSTEAV